MKKIVVVLFIGSTFFQLLTAKNSLKSCISCEKFLGHLKSPVALSSLNKNEILIIEQIGNVLLYNTRNNTIRTLLNLTDKVVYDSSRTDKNPEQRGLLGLAVNPSCFPNCNSFYLHYSSRKLSNAEDHRSVVKRFLITAGKVEEDKIILSEPQPSDISNGGQLFFDKQDNLYITIGDSGLRNEAFRNTSKLGKILQTNVAKGKEKHEIEIFASGFENPWRCGIAPKGIICGDVGVQNEDRICIATKGGIHGWRDGNDYGPNHKLPIHIHGEKTPSAVIGGLFYTGNDLPQLNYSFIYGDFVDGSLHALSEDGRIDEWKSEKLNLCCNCKLISDHSILSFGEDYLKNVYVLTRAKDNKLEGIIYKLIDLDNEISCDGSVIKSGLYLVASIEVLLLMFA